MQVKNAMAISMFCNSIYIAVVISRIYEYDGGKYQRLSENP
jgi:hypothetical protein